MFFSDSSDFREMLTMKANTNLIFVHGKLDKNKLICCPNNSLIFYPIHHSTKQAKDHCMKSNRSIICCNIYRNNVNTAVLGYEGIGVQRGRGTETVLRASETI